MGEATKFQTQSPPEPQERQTKRKYHGAAAAHASRAQLNKLPQTSWNLWRCAKRLGDIALVLSDCQQLNAIASFIIKAHSASHAWEVLPLHGCQQLRVCEVFPDL